MGMVIKHDEFVGLKLKGQVFCKMVDRRTGEVLVEWGPRENIVTLDAGVLMASLFADTLVPPHSPAQHVGVTMLGVGTGAAGNPLNPDVPQATQRRLVQEIARKAVVPTFVDAGGNAVAYRTRTLDLACTFYEGEAVGPLDEMALMSTYSLNPGDLTHRIDNGPGTPSPVYDDTIDTTLLDLLANYLTFPVISKPDTAVLTFVWRLTFG